MYFQHGFDFRTDGVDVAALLIVAGEDRGKAQRQESRLKLFRRLLADGKIVMEIAHPWFTENGRLIFLNGSLKVILFLGEFDERGTLLGTIVSSVGDRRRRIEFREAGGKSLHNSFRSFLVLSVELRPSIFPVTPKSQKMIRHLGVGINVEGLTILTFGQVGIRNFEGYY